jgi:hypothetical protein
MSSTYVKPTGITQTVRRSLRRPGFLGLGAALAGVTAVGAAAVIYFSPAQAPAVPAAPPAALSWPAIPAEDASTAPPERLAVPAPSVGWPRLPAEDASTAPPERLPGPSLGALPLNAVDPGDPESSAASPAR